MWQLQKYFNNHKHLPGSSAPVQAVQPIMGGMAPTTDPTHVLAMERRFMGV